MDNRYICDFCLEKFDNKERFIKHHKNNHMKQLFTCEECKKMVELVQENNFQNVEQKIQPLSQKEHHAHLVEVHNYQFCKDCKISYKQEEKHECGEVKIAYLCTFEKCRERYYSKLNFFVRHLQKVHKIAEFNTIKYFIENNCKEIIKPYKIFTPQIFDDKGVKISDSKKSNQEFENFANYVNLYKEDEEDSFTDSSITQSEKGIQKSSSFFKVENKINQSELLIKREDFSEEEQQPSSSAVKNQFKKFSTTTKNRTNGKENEYELLLCRYKDNKRFIRSIKYEDLLLKALSLIQSIQRKQKIFSLIRYGRPDKNAEAYSIEFFKSNFKICLQTSYQNIPEFETLIEKLWMVRNYSKINHKLFEHKRHSNYMLNKRLRLVCTNCNHEPFKFFDQFIKHYKICLFKSISTCQHFKCPICTRLFLNYFALIQHLEIEHFIMQQLIQQMNFKECEFCHLKDESIYSFSFSCGHSKNICFNCIEKKGQQSECFECSNKKCYQCDGNIDKNKMQEFTEIKFKLCEKNHSVFQCKSCFDKKCQKILSDEEKVCFLCLVKLKKQKLLYYTEKLSCQNHSVNLCGKCNEIFKKGQKRCIICDPIKIKQNSCFACYNPIDFEVKIKPIMCFNSKHYFSLCMTCATNLEKPYLICRICQDKNCKDFVIMQTNQSDYSNTDVIQLKFFKNELEKEKLILDDFDCPICKPINMIVSSVSNGENSSGLWINPSNAILPISDSEILITGGYNISLHSSLSSCYIFKFLRDGRFRYFEVDTLIKNLIKKRHSHGACFCQEQKTVYIFGGICKNNQLEIEFLDTIELLLLPDDNYSYDNEMEWQGTKMKLMEKRANFGQIQANKKVYIFGGFKGIGELNNNIEELDFINQNSKIIQIDSNLKIPIQPAVIKLENQIFILGGFDGKKICDKVLSFDLEKKTGQEENFKIENHWTRVRGVEFENNLLLFGNQEVVNKEKKEEKWFLGKFDQQTGFHKIEEKVPLFQNTKSDFDLLDFYEGCFFEFKINSQQMIF